MGPLGFFFGLFAGFQAFDIAFDERGVLVNLVGISVGNQEGRSLFDSISFGQFLVGRRIDVLIMDMIFVEEHLGHLAVGAGRAGEEHDLFDCRGFDVREVFRGNTVTSVFA